MALFGGNPEVIFDAGALVALRGHWVLRRGLPPLSPRLFSPQGIFRSLRSLAENLEGAGRALFDGKTP
jgi:hypothetical protein